MLESRLRAVLVPFSSWQLQKVSSWMCPGMAWQGLTSLLWLSRGFSLLATPCKPGGSTGTSMVPLHQAAELQGGLPALGKGCALLKQYSRELFMWHLGSPKLLLLSPVKVPVCPLTGVYARNVPAPDLPCEHCTPVLTLPSLPMPSSQEGPPS